MPSKQIERSRYALRDSARLLFGSQEPPRVPLWNRSAGKRQAQVRGQVRTSPERAGTGGVRGETFRSTSKPVFVESYPMWGARDGVRSGPETDQGLSLLVPGVRKEWLRKMDTPGLTYFWGLSTGYPLFKDTSTGSVSSNDWCPV